MYRIVAGAKGVRNDLRYADIHFFTTTSNTEAELKCTQKWLTKWHDIVMEMEYSFQSYLDFRNF